MDNLIVILFICIAVPLLFSLLLVNNQAKLIIGFMIIGLFLCLFISNINGLIAANSTKTYFYITSTYTPITEEFIKAIPIIIFGFCFNTNKHTLLAVGMAEGIGFAVLENTYILASNINSISIIWGLSRVIGASLMHGICTAAIGYGMSLVKIRKKLFVPGTFAILISAIIYHGTFNVLVQSEHVIHAYVLPLATYIPITIREIRKYKKKKVDLEKTN